MGTDFSKLQPDDFVTAVVELQIKNNKKIEMIPIRNVGSVHFITTKWGKTAMWTDGDCEISWQPVSAASMLTPTQKFAKEKKDALGRGSADELLALAETCVKIGLP